MHRVATVVLTSFGFMAAATAQSASSGGDQDTASPLEFQPNQSGTPGLARGATPSKITPTATEAALKFTLVDKDKGPIPGIVISLTDPAGKTFYTEETDAVGYAEVLVPVGRDYEVVYLSLGRRKIAARIPVSAEPRQTIRLTLRYKRHDTAPAPLAEPPASHAEPPAPPVEPPAERFVLQGVHFDTGKATLRQESFARLDAVVEYLTHKRSARIEISGHTDNVGKPKKNKQLSERRALACRDYLISKGIDGSRVLAVGFGDERPVAANDSAEGRQQNRRIEVTELQASQAR